MFPMVQVVLIKKDRTWIIFNMLKTYHHIESRFNTLSYINVVLYVTLSQ